MPKTNCPTPREAMKAAAEALEASIDNFPANAKHQRALSLLRAALEGGEEPVACVACKGNGWTDEGDPEIGRAIMECDRCNGTGVDPRPCPDGSITPVDCVCQFRDDEMRAAFEAWVQDRGCDTDGAWSAWQAAWSHSDRPIAADTLRDAEREGGSNG